MVAPLLLLYAACVHACLWDQSVGLWRVSTEQTVWEAAAYLSGSEDDAVRIRELKDVIVEKNPNLKKPVYVVEGQVFTVPYSPVASPASWITHTSIGCTPYLEFPGQRRTDNSKATPTAYPTQGTYHPGGSECACAWSTRSTVVVMSGQLTTGSPSQEAFVSSWTSLLSSGGATRGGSSVTSMMTTEVQTSTHSSMRAAPSEASAGDLMCRDGRGKADAKADLLTWAVAFCSIQREQALQANNSTISQLFYGPSGGLYYFSVQRTPACPTNFRTATAAHCLSIMTDIHTKCSGKDGVGPGGSIMWGCALYNYELLDVNRLYPLATGCIR
ncbi:hypothetical protein PCL_07078 [Purpureocillium lilacinum]|uniref:LysM domain-containing protein n=1 Tax=Purpureocillium lilacinum TaxID=33203 RepID=A0A2U3DT95_PURLI|nr:hypothetical protein PCL_07078 [Purpureocillium lilacinum]